MFRNFLQNQDASTAIEYAVIAGVLVLAIVMGATEVGRLVGETYGNVSNEVSAAIE